MIFRWDTSVLRPPPPKVKWSSCEADHSSHLVPKIRMSRAISPLCYMFSWSALGQLYFHSTFTSTVFTQKIVRIKENMENNHYQNCPIRGFCWKKAVKSVFHVDNHLHIVSVMETSVCAALHLTSLTVCSLNNDKFTSHFLQLKAYYHG